MEKQVEELTNKMCELLPFDCEEVCQPPAREILPNVTRGKPKQIYVQEYKEMKSNQSAPNQSAPCFR